MSINDLLGERTPLPPSHRLTPRSPLSVKELTAILILGGLVWAAYDRLNHFAEKTVVEKIVETQWLQRLETQHNFDSLNAKVDQLIKSQQASDAEKKPQPRNRP